MLYPPGSHGETVSGLFQMKGGMDSMSGVNIILQKKKWKL